MEIQSPVSISLVHLKILKVPSKEINFHQDSRNYLRFSIIFQDQLQGSSQETHKSDPNSYSIIQSTFLISKPTLLKDQQTTCSSLTFTSAFHCLPLKSINAMGKPKKKSVSNCEKKTTL